MMLGIVKKSCRNAAIYLILYTTVLSCGTPQAISEDHSAMTLGALFTSLGVPSDCGITMPWDGSRVTIQGYVDPDNIFDKKHYPRLPYEKFRLTDRKGRFMEIWVKSKESRAIFSKVYGNKNKKRIITGVLEVVRMPVMGNCQLGAKVWINDPSQIQ